jgi:hypothetical protein
MYVVKKNKRKIKINKNKNLVWPRDLESFKGGKFNTLSLVDCYVQICNGTAVEQSHGSLLNCSGVCDGINCCSVKDSAFKTFEVTGPHQVFAYC